MQKWEYKVIITSSASLDLQHAGSSGTKNPEAELNEAGEQGWELFQVLSFPRGGAVSVCHYLRRPKAERHEAESGLAEMTPSCRGGRPQPEEAMPGTASGGRESFVAGSGEVTDEAIPEPIRPQAVDEGDSVFRVDGE